MPSKTSSFEDIDSSSLLNMKSNLESYKEIILHLNQYISWKNIEESYPIPIFVSLVYLLVWQLDMPLLCVFFLSCFILVIIDYVNIKYISGHTKNSKTSLSSTQEKEFDQICGVIVTFQKQIKKTIQSYYENKDEYPFWMCAVTGSILMVLALVSKLLGDTIFSFLFINFIFMYPGLKSNGYIDRASVYIFSTVADTLRAFQGKKIKEN